MPDHKLYDNDKALDDAIAATILANSVHIDIDEPAIVDIEYLDNPLIPKGRAIGFYGRGESGKSTVVSTLCAQNSNMYSTLWISSEEPSSHIKLRHTHSGASDGTIGVVDSSDFDVQSHLLSAIRKAKQKLSKPLGFVVLDAIVTLVTWQNKGGPNDDAEVKKLLSFVDRTAQEEDVSILLIGHLNKGKGHAHMADAVLGAAAWTNSLRLSYLLQKLPDEDYTGFIRTAKSNMGTHFGAFYRTEPVYQMQANIDGYKPTLCKVEWTSERIYGARDLALAMGESKDEATKAMNARDIRIKDIADRILQILQNKNQLPRAIIPHELGHNVTGRDWTSIDPLLRSQGVKIENGERNKMYYQLCTATPPP